MASCLHDFVVRFSQTQKQVNVTNFAMVHISEAGLCRLRDSDHSLFPLARNSRTRTPVFQRFRRCSEKKLVPKFVFAAS